MTDLKPGNARAAKITGAMLLREFFMLRELEEEENKIRLKPGDLPSD